MTIFRRKREAGKDKNPEEATTRLIRPKGREEAETQTLTGGLGGLNADDVPTDLVGKAASPTPSATEEPKTQLVGPSRRRGGSAEPSDGMDDPVVGWLVVLDGPGRGLAAQLGYGMNHIGRDASQRVSLDHGDEQISRENHAIITYDPRSRRFYLQHGGGVNLTYLNDEPVLNPTELKGGESISIGQTTLRFVPFCGSDFDWQAE